MELAEDTYEKIAEKLMVKPSRLMLDILKMIADPEDAELLLAMPAWRLSMPLPIPSVRDST